MNLSVLEVDPSFQEQLITFNFDVFEVSAAQIIEVLVCRLRFI